MMHNLSAGPVRAASATTGCQDLRASRHLESGPRSEVHLEACIVGTRQHSQVRMDSHVPACSTIQLSILRQIKFVLVHPGGNAQLACRNGNVVSYHTGAFGNFQDNLPGPLECHLQVSICKVT